MKPFTFVYKGGLMVIYLALIGYFLFLLFKGVNNPNWTTGVGSAVIATFIIKLLPHIRALHEKEHDKKPNVRKK